jgi:hypothetical protein
LIQDVEADKNMHNYLKSFWPNFRPACVCQELITAHGAETFEELLQARISHRLGKGKLIKCFCLGLGRAVKVSTSTKKWDLHTIIRED